MKEVALDFPLCFVLEMKFKKKLQLVPGRSFIFS